MTDVVSTPPSAWNRAPWWVAGVALVVHAVGLWGGYTFDDFAAVLRHPAVTGQAPLIEVFTREYWGRPLDAGWSSSYRPISTLSFALAHRLVAQAWLQHAFNLLLYSGLCAMVVVFLRRHIPPVQALLGGLLFAVWPIHVENVASIVGRADVLAAGFSLLALWAADAVASAVDAGRTRSDGVGAPAGAATEAQAASESQVADARRPEMADNVVEPERFSSPSWARIGALSALAAAAYLLALLSKEGVALLPGVAGWFLLVRWRSGALARHRRVAGIVPVAALALTGMLYLALRQAWLPVGLPTEFVGADNALRALSGPTRWWANLSLLGNYGEIATVPARLCADHTYGDVMPPTGEGLAVLTSWRPWLGVAIVAVICRDAWRAWHGQSAGMWVAFGLTYLLVGQWVIDLSVTFAERLFLWPSVFVAGAIPAGLARLFAHQPPETRRRLFGAFVVLGLLFAGRSVDRSLDWKTPLSLYRSSARACPAAVHNRLSLAKTWQKQGRPDEALWNYAIALAGHRAFPTPFVAKAFAVEHVEPLASRLRRLPELVDLGGSPAQVWPALAQWLDRRGASAEAALARKLALAAPQGVAPASSKAGSGDAQDRP